MIGFLVTGLDVSKADVEKYLSALRRAQMEIDLHPELYKHYHAAIPVLWRSLELATEADDTAAMAEALRHLGIAEHAAGRLKAPRLHLEESTRLRREMGAGLGLRGLARPEQRSPRLQQEVSFRSAGGAGRRPRRRRRRRPDPGSWRWPPGAPPERRPRSG
jgi:hypothetical protein